MANPTLKIGIALAILAGACEKAVPIDWSFIQPNESALYVLSKEDGTFRLVAQNGRGPPPILSARDSQPIYVVLYPVDLSVIGLVPGEIALQGRLRGPWPAGYRSFALEGPDRDRRLLSNQELEDALGERFLPVIDPEVCRVGNGCFRFTPSSDQHTECQLPCDGPVTVAPPMPPMPPVSPTLSACPSTWGSVEVAGVRTCEPPPLLSCGPGQMQGYDDASCRPVGAACEVGPWPSGLPPGRAPIYVQADAAAPGDGSQGSPFPTIGAGIASAGPSSVVVVSAGSYAENLAIDADLILLGLCPERTIVTGADRSQPVLSLSPGAIVDVAGFTFVADQSDGIRSHGARIEAHGVVLEGGEHGIWALDATDLEGRDLLIEGQRTLGIESNDSTLHLDGVVVRGALQGGWLQQSTITIERSTFAENRGPGLRISHESEATIDATSFRKNLGTGLLIDNQTSAELHDVQVFGEAGQSNTDGVRASASSTLIAQRLQIVDTSSAGLRLGSGDPETIQTSGELSDLVILRTGSDCLTVQSATARLERGLLFQCVVFGISSPDSTTTVTDVAIRGVALSPIPDQGHGTAFDFYHSGTMTIERVLVEDASTAIRAVTADPGELRVTDFEVNRSSIYAVGIYGRVNAFLTRVAINETVGTPLQIGSAGSSNNSVLLDIKIHGADSYGLQLWNGQATAERVLIERARVAGLWLDQVNATIEDLEVDDTQYLLADRVREQGVGIAIGIGQATGDLEIADLKLTRFRLENNAAPGLWLGLGAEYQLSEGWIVGKKGYDTNKIDFKPGIDLAGIRFAEPQGQ